MFRMARLKFFTVLSAFIALAALVALAVLWQREYEARRQLRSQTDELHEQLNRLMQLEIENIRLSNIVARAETPLAESQLAELQKLRQQVESLRRQTNQLQTLQAEIGRLQAALSSVRNSMAAGTSPDVPPEDIYPRELWAFAGYDTPENAIETLAWAISEGDQETYLAALTPEMRDRMQADLGGGDFADEGPLGMSDTTGFRIVDREAVSDNEVIYTLYMDGENDEMPVVLQNTNGQWLVAGAGDFGE